MRIQLMIYPLILLFVASLYDVAPAVAETALVGKVTRVQGITSASGRVLEADSDVFDGDLLITEEGARLEITFIDGSLLTLGGPAKLFIDEMAYGQTGSTEARARQTIESLEGAFRFITGAVGRDAPEAVKIVTPVATIGIRGTDFWGGPIDRGSSFSEFGVLLFEGEVVVSGANGEVVLDGFTEGTFIASDGSLAPTDPGTWQEQTISDAVATITFTE